jgi:uncharacterized protein YbaR (Trm112 family)
MNAKEELLKLTLGKIVTGVLLLIGFLIAVVWREALFQTWTQVAEGLSRPALLALLGLALIGALLEALGIAYLLYLLYRTSSTRKDSHAKTPQAMTKRFGVMWDADLNPHCPIDTIVMRPLLHVSNRDHDILLCPNCDRKYPLHAENLTPLLLPNAQRLINPSKALIAPMLKRFGLLWDADQVPHCPADQTQLNFFSRKEAKPGRGEHEFLRCSKCGTIFPMVDPYHGHLTLHTAINFIREDLNRGRISD